MKKHFTGKACFLLCMAIAWTMALSFGDRTALAQNRIITTPADLTTALGDASVKTLLFNQPNISSADPVGFAGGWGFDTNGHAAGNAMLTAPKITLTGGELQLSGVILQSITPNNRTFTLLEAGNGGISDRFLNVNWGDSLHPTDFLDLKVQKNAVSADKTQVTVTQELRWYRGVTSANGTFTVDSGSTFNVGVELTDQKRNIIVGDAISSGDLTHGWDGKSLTKAGEGTLILSAANRYSGATTINAGTLRLGTTDAIANSSGVHLAAGATLDAGDFNQTLHDLTGDGNLLIRDSRTLTLDHGHDTRFSGSFSGGGDFVKQGMGTLTLSGRDGTPESPKNISVAQGRLILNQALHSRFAVFDGAAIGGIGSSVAIFDFRSGAFHNPGNSIDTFRADSIHYAGGATIIIEVGRDAAGNIIADNIIAQNDIAFAQGGGTATVHFVNFEETIREKSATGFDITVFQSENGTLLLDTKTLQSIYAGTTDTITLDNIADDAHLVFVADPSLNVESTSFDSNSMTGQSLTVRLTPTGLVTPLSDNQLSVLRSLEGGGSLRLGVLGATGDQRRDALDQLTPTLDTVSPIVTRRSIARFNSAAFQRLEHLGFHGRSGCTPKLHQLWGILDGDLTKQKTVNDVYGYKLKSGGLSAGLDMMLLSDFIFGISVGGAETKSNLYDNLSSGKTDMFQTSLYSMWFANNWSLKTSAGYSWNRYTIDRDIPISGEHAHSQHDGNAIFAGAELAKRFRFNQTLLTPYIRFDFVNLWEDGYTEEGAPIAGLRVDKRTTQAYLQTIGLRWERDCFFNNGWVIRPELYGGWIHDYGQGAIRTTSTLPGQSPFTITGVSTVPDRALLGAGLSIAPWENWLLFGRYEAEFTDDFVAQIGQVGLSFLW